MMVRRKGNFFGIPLAGAKDRQTKGKKEDIYEETRRKASVFFLFLFLGRSSKQPETMNSRL